MCNKLSDDVHTCMIYMYDIHTCMIYMYIYVAMQMYVAMSYSIVVSDLARYMILCISNTCIAERR